MSEKSPEPDFDFIIDSPKTERLADKRITISGWLVPRKGKTVRDLRLRNNNRFLSLNYGLERKDVAQAFPEADQKSATYSGFSVDLEIEGGEYVIEADLGAGYEEVKSLQLRYIGGQPMEVQYNPHLASSWAEHVDLLSGRQQYFFEDQAVGSFDPSPKDIKAVAFYLPQFYPIPENDLTWGRGFTEWRNVATAQARFVGHQQPVLPRDLGFYDLRVDTVIEDQIELAKQYGLHGFCFYYYWFSGKKILDIPINSFLKNKEWNFNFMICWANENWTKRWDGLDKDVIIAQQYLPEDPLNFIKDVENILLDPRYIRVDGKPALAIYRTADLKDPQQYVKTWREYFKKKHKLELHLISVLSFNNEDPKELGFDASIEFMPQGIQFRASDFPNHDPPKLDVTKNLLDINYDGTAFDYRSIVLDKKFHKPLSFNPYACVMPSWDKDARKKGKDSATFHNSSPDLYAHWLDVALRNARKNENELIFINAWNEWAEGTVLEPSLHYGHAHLKKTAEVLAKYSAKPGNEKRFPLLGIKRTRGTELAVVVHVYYKDQWEAITKRLSMLGNQKHDLYITLTDKEAEFASSIANQFPKANIIVVPNRGRDILPFMHVARRLDAAGYKSVLKLHTKRSLHRKDGSKWLDNLLESLLPSRAMVAKTLKLLGERPAIIGPRGHYVSLDAYIGSNETYMKNLLERTEFSKDFDQKEHAYFAGSMFWASLEALRPLLNLYIMSEDFESEKGHVDGTMAHAIERLFGLVADLQGIDSYALSRWRLEKVKPSKASSNYKYAK